jgi:hypothetical protein
MEFLRILICSCHDPEHQVIFRGIEEDGFPREISLEYHLTTGDFLHRVKEAFKYTFGFKSRYGLFGNVLINKNNVHILQQVVDHLRE